VSIFTHQQVATDYSPLKNINKWLPTNLDAVTERVGRFLVMENKCGEPVSIGQMRMLQAMAKLPQFTVLIVNCEWVPTDNFGARLFKPESYSIMTAEGKLSPPIGTSTQDFAARYEKWCRQPKSVGIAAWELNQPAMAERRASE